MDDFFMLLLIIAVAIFIISLIRSTRGPSSSSSNAATPSKPQTATKTQMAEDIKATKTSQVSDAVSILEDLSSTSDNYRHYCELVGSSMASGGVTAPYSRKQVAYYDIKCYRLDATAGGGQRETLVAHEHSFDPFFFTDLSCDTPIYVDLESFGNNVILVNSTNHIEGPNSDFAKAFKKSATAATSGAGSASNAYAMVAHAIKRGANALAWAADAIRSALAPHNVFQPQFALAGGASLDLATEAEHRFSNVLFAHARGAGPRGDSSQSRGGGPRGDSPQGRGGSSKSGININIGFGGAPPANMGSFMGGFGGGPWVMGGGMGYGHYGHHGNRPTTSTNSAEVLLGMGLGALLNSMTSMTSAQQQATQTFTTPADTFRGYRLVENVVPLGSPVYCIGEIYHNGTDIYMGRSLAKDYPTSYFATKPETEVLSAIGSR